VYAATNLDFLKVTTKARSASKLR